MKISLFGAGKEVGRSCVFVKNNGKKVFFDSGIKIFNEPDEQKGNGDKYPLQHDLSADALFLSHAHLDHSGAIPFYKSQGAPFKVFSTETTKFISEILLKDSYKIERINKEPKLYRKSDITSALNGFSLVSNGKNRTYRDIKFKFFHAGHIPGSSSIKANIGGKNVVYTGDINNSETNLMHKANSNFGNDVNTLIIECTYGDRDHPDREAEEKEFLDLIEQTIEEGGSVIIPSFAVGRTQEILIILSKRKFDVPIYVDGMGKKMTEVMINNPWSINNEKVLRKMYSRAKKVGYMRQRKDIFHRQCIIVTTAGMMSGGPVIDYLKHMNKPQNHIFITGYQAEGTNGRQLVEKGTIELDDRKYRVASKFTQFDFSAHSGRKELLNVIKKTNPQNVVLNHGDAPSIESVRQWCKKEGFRVFGPENGEILKLD